MLKGWELIIRLFLAVIFGGIIGLQRETSERPAGFRTHILVALGSAIFTIVSFFPFEGGGRTATDPTRIAAAVVTGIGFLGAGTIIRRENLVIGLTTAASLWAVAAVGVATASGYYAAGFVGTALILATLTVFKRIELRVLPIISESSVGILASDGPAVLAEAHNLLEELQIEIKSASIRRMGRDKAEIELMLESSENIDRVHLLEALGAVSGVHEVKFGLFRRGDSELF